MTPVPQQEESCTKTVSNQKKRPMLRPLLLFVVPLCILIASAYIYATGGRYVETENAYIQADMIIISPEVSGAIVSVSVKENEHVKKGAPLFRIEDKSYSIRYEEAQAKLQDELSEINTLKAGYRQKKSELELSRKNVNFSIKEFNRISTLADRKVVSESKLDDARHEMEVNLQRFKIIQDAVQQILVKLEGDPKISPEKIASYRLAHAQLDKAELDLEKTIIRAPFNGRVGRIPKIGQQVRPGSSVMSLIDDNRFWIEANLKETDLTHVRPGQKVEILVDSYPNGKWSGEVESISPATGSKYAIIPPQNATGNWVKVVQRVPVRISITGPQGNNTLCAGMSVSISIDTEYSRPLPLVSNKTKHSVQMPHLASEK